MSKGFAVGVLADRRIDKLKSDVRESGEGDAYGNPFTVQMIKQESQLLIYSTALLVIVFGWLLDCLMICVRRVLMHKSLIVMSASQMCLARFYFMVLPFVQVGSCRRDACDSRANACPSVISLETVQLCIKQPNLASVLGLHILC